MEGKYKFIDRIIEQYRQELISDTDKMLVVRDTDDMLAFLFGTKNGRIALQMHETQVPIVDPPMYYSVVGIFTLDEALVMLDGNITENKHKLPGLD